MRYKIIAVLVSVAFGLLLGWNLSQRTGIAQLRADLNIETEAREYYQDRIKEDISGLRARATGLRKDVDELKTTQTAINSDIYNLELQKSMSSDVDRIREIQILQVLGKLAGGVVFDASDCIELDNIWVSDKEMRYWAELHPITPDLTVRIQHPYGTGTTRTLYAYPADEVSPGSVVRLFCGRRFVLGTPEVYLAEGYGYTVYDLSEYNSAVRLAANSN